MFRKIKNWFLVKWYRFQFDYGFRDRKDYLPPMRSKTREQRERELYAFLEANKDRFNTLFEYKSKGKHASIMRDIVNAYENYNPSDFREYLEVKMRPLQPRRSFNSLFSKDKKRKLNKNYKKAGKISEETKWYLDKNKELRQKHFDSVREQRPR